MNVFWFVAAAVALGVMIFYGRILFKRVLFSARLKKACQPTRATGRHHRSGARHAHARAQAWILCGPKPPARLPAAVSARF